MSVCASCSSYVAESAKYCPECGAAREQPAGGRVMRKTVTVLFSDLVGSTALGERHDPEQVRALMERYFAAMRTVIERHGGTVEKFIGDAIMAVFGIPVLHEDDALRAVRAAAEMRERLAQLNAELNAAGSPLIQTRTGVNTGEVVTGTPESATTLATGDAVNTAARLEQAAAPGEILLGELTWQLVRHDVITEPAPPIRAKGKSTPVVAHRLLRMSGSGRATARPSTPLVGREAELDAVRRVWSRVAVDRAPAAITVIGGAGVGKSRLVTEFLAGLDGATVLRGTCLPYGDGITYWPLAEVMRSAAGFDEADSAAQARARVDALLGDEEDAPAIAARLAEAIGLDPGGSPQAEIFWAVRRSLQAIARRRPVVVVWDDLQWAEPTFVELVEHLSAQIREVPLLLVLMARPELLEARSDWASATRSHLVTLEPLDATATEALLASLPGGEALPTDLRRRIATAAEGNPLFVEEMLAMLVDDGRLVETAGGWIAAGDLEQVGVPPTITALLAARIDRLASPERSVAERASVVGRSFEVGAVGELGPAAERSQLEDRLLALAQRQITEPDSQVGLDGGETHRFRHLLIRDAAYAALPKAERATLHEAVAGWLERTVGERIGEFTELAAHHLEQAYRFRLDLGSRPETVAELGRRAAAHFAAAAQQAFGRGDVGGATALRRRALTLPLGPAERVEVLIEQARSDVDRGDIDEATRLLDDAAATPGRLDDERLEQRLKIARAYAAIKSAGGSPGKSDIDEVLRAATVLEALGDAAGVAMAMDLYAFALFFAGDIETAGSAWRTAADWATKSGDRGELARILPALPATSTYGWATMSETIAYCRELLDANPDSPMLEARALGVMADPYLERGDVDLATELRERSRRILNELGVPWLRVEMAGADFDFEMMLGDWEAAERAALVSYELATEFGWRRATAAIALVEAVYEQGRIAEADRWLKVAEEDVEDDISDMAMLIDSYRALIMVAQGDWSGALTIVQHPIPETIEPATRAGLHVLRGRALDSLGEGRMALEHYAIAAQIFRRKEAYRSLGDVTERMAQLSPRDGG